MSLAPDTRLGPYEIVSPLGAGGMGEVYRAKDTRLGRDVALKVLPADVARDGDRRTRFEREARAVAALSHPNILAIHDIGTDADTLFVVTELLEGETLADRVRQGALPVRKAVEITIAIARGLAAAHEKGIAHRDLKPANIFLLADGQVKILDFGLARELSAATGATQTQAALTDPGTVLGTAGYMAPEQIRGQHVDGRADLFALGVVLYEMLTGQRAFARETTAETLTAILKEDPAELTATRADLPPALDRIVRHALEKNPTERFQTARDVIFALDALSGSTAAVARAVGSATSSRVTRALAWAGPALVAAAIVVYGSMGRSAAPDSDPSVIRTSLVLPPDAPMMPPTYPSACLAISPSASHVVYCAGVPGWRLYVRALDSTDARPIEGTDKGTQPFFSPDGEWIGFFTSDGAIKKVALTGGTPVTLARGLSYSLYVNGSWLTNGRIVFDTWNAGLRTIAADGGPIETLTTPTDEWHQFPQPLPGGRIMYTVLSASAPRVEARPAGGGDPTVLLANAAHARYLESGHLVFVRDGGVMAAPFDAPRLTLTGDARPAGIAPMVDNPAAAAPLPQLAVSATGTLVYTEPPPGAGDRILLTANLATRGIEDVVRLPAYWSQLSLSPDGSRLALSGREGGVVRVSVLDLRSQTTTRLGDHAQDFPTGLTWSADGKRLFVGTFTTHRSEILSYDVQGSTTATRVHEQPGTWTNLTAMSRDGRTLVYGIVQTAENGQDLWTLDLGASPPRAQPFLATPALEWDGAISPDGSWIAYLSDESGKADVYLQRFPGGGAKMRAAEGIGAVGGAQWSDDGRELFVLAEGGNTLFSIPVRWQPDPVVGKPVALLKGSFVPSGDGGRSFAVGRDGRHVFLVRQPANFRRATQIEVVQHWFAELRRLTAPR